MEKQGSPGRLVEKQVNFRISIPVKLLLFILPLVCLPIAVVGYFSIQASVERVNRLVRQEQMVQVESVAHKINQVFYTCRIDLDTITSLPVLEDYHLARLFRLHAEAEFNRASLIKLLGDIISRTPYYHRISFVGLHGQELIRVGRKGTIAGKRNLRGDAFFQRAISQSGKGAMFSRLVNSRERGGYVIHCAKQFYYGWRELAGLVVIDLDFEKLIEVVRAVHVGHEGYSFLVDEKGNTLIHPKYPPYKHHIGNYPDPSIERLVKNMVQGKTGWENYWFQDKLKVAAFAPIPIMNWSLAVTIPMEEFGREAQAIKTKVIQTVAVTLMVALLGVYVLSYNLSRPVRRLVAATNRLASGDLDQEIPVKSRDELGDLTRSFNRMVRNLARIQSELVRSEKLISLGRLSAGVAHEIRNPLNAMKGAMVHLQQRWAHEPLIQQYTKLVSEEIDRLNRVVTEILYFAKQSPPKLEKADLNRVITDAQGVLAEEAEQRGVRFVNELDPSLPLVSLDEHQMEQVLLNLVFNAMDAMPDGGELRFITKIAADNPSQVKLTVEDSGEGISQDDLPNVFDPFYTTKEDGTGLGLPLSMGIVEGHGGVLDIESRVGVGTKVSITLPLSSPRME
jgi:two-component system NtrC family sensor kinase